MAIAQQMDTSAVPPNETSGSVRPLVGSMPVLTPMLMIACTPIHRPMPCATSAG